MDLGLGGKVAIVTGAASGMGRAVASTLAAEGVRVAAADLDQAGALRTCEKIAERDGEAHAHRLDVTLQGGWTSLVTAVERDLGPIDILCNIAGPGARLGHLETDEAEWRRQLDGHLTGTFLGCQAVLPGMMERHSGKIVNMCSFTAHAVNAGIPAYSAAFGGVLTYTKSLARFAAPHGINVNCVSPGNIDTAMTRAGWLDKPENRERLRAAMPVGRIGVPEDVAVWFAVLASDRTRHTVGAEINVSGGQLLLT